MLHLLSPAGFVANGVYAGIKSKKSPDVGLLFAVNGPASAAAVFTTNQVCAAPVTVGRMHIKSGTLRGVVVNSGNANACTGQQGLSDAIRMCQLAAMVPGCKPREILPSSTGIIGHLMPMNKVEKGIELAAQDLGDSADHADAFARAIMTTDLKKKTAEARFKIDGKTVILAGVCKGSGMIGPRMAVPHATMLAYLTTDAQIDSTLLSKLLGSASDQSFNCVTVDDHTSTNDTAVLLASGLSGAKIARGSALQKFADALNEVCQSLAYQIAQDGEGATKVVYIEVKKRRQPRRRQHHGPRHRQLQPRQMRHARQRPQLGPNRQRRGPDHREIQSRKNLPQTRRHNRLHQRPPRNLQRRQSLQSHERRRSPNHPRLRRRKILGQMLDLRPLPRLHPHQRRLPHLTP